MQSPVMDLEILLAMASLVTDQEVAFSTPFWMQAILWVYLSGGLFFLFLFIHSSFNIIRIIRKGDVMKLENGIRLVVTTLPVSPFSWMKYIVISEQDMRDSGDTIIRHEMAHIQSCHSLDLIIAECCVFLHWFNPAVWFFKQELQNIHEYEADESVISQGVDAKNYQLLLIKKAVGIHQFTSMANSLNHSSLKKRIAMMLKRKSSPWVRLKYVAVLPLVACLLVAFARPEVSREFNRISDVGFSEMLPTRDVSVAEEVKADVLEVSSVVTPSPENEVELIELNTVKEAISEKVISRNNITAKLEAKSPFEDTNQMKKLMDIRLRRDLRGTVNVQQGSVSFFGESVEEEKPLTINSLIALSNPLIVSGGEIILPEDVRNIDPNTIAFVRVLKDGYATEAYGNIGMNGVIEIVLK
jgi:hypothetical protein